MKQIPYGLTDFGRIQKENYYYVDKTMFIKKSTCHITNINLGVYSSPI